MSALQSLLPPTCVLPSVQKYIFQEDDNRTSVPFQLDDPYYFSWFLASCGVAEHQFLVGSASFTRLTMRDIHRTNTGHKIMSTRLVLVGQNASLLHLRLKRTEYRWKRS